jgi:hypothetical protein
MATLSFRVVNALPGVLTPHTMYLVKSGSNVKIYVSNEDGTQALEATGGSGGGTVVEDGIDAFLLMGVSEHV